MNKSEEIDIALIKAKISLLKQRPPNDLYIVWTNSEITRLEGLVKRIEGESNE